MKQKDKAPDHDKELKDLRKQIARLEAASAFAGKDCEKDTFSALNYRMIYHQVNDAILVLNLETGTIIDANRKTLEMFGYPPEEITKLTIEDLSAGEPQKVTLSWIMDAARTKPQLFEWIARSREGKRFWVEVNLKRVVTAGNDHILAVVRDITDRKNMEETLRHSEQRYRDLFENANDAIFIVDSGLNYIDVNKKAIEMLGHSKEELLTMNILDVIPEEQIPRSEAEFRKLKETGSYEKFIGKIRTKDGRLIDVEVNSSAIMDGNRIIGSRDIVRDITERKKMEEEIIKAQKLESIGMLAGGLAHDFNNLLTGILGNISLAKMHILPNSKSYEKLESAEKASLRAKDLTQQLITFSLGGAPVKKTTDISELLKDTAGFALRGSNVRCEFSIPGNLRPVDIDKGQISQAISNLIINADQAMPEGGLIQVRAENVPAGAEAVLPSQQKDYIKISIEDHGTGIAAEHKEKIFDPYFTTKEGGSGLGLAISYSVVRRHEGIITVESQWGGGATFHLYLPASEKEPAREEEIEPVAVGGKGKILVMDDDDIVRDVACEMIREMGYEVESVEEGKAAIELYRKARETGKGFDAVIIDLTIPGGMGGKETIQRLRDLDPDIRAIVSSGYSNDPIMSDFSSYGFSAVVIKPYKISELSNALQRVIAGCR